LRIFNSTLKRGAKNSNNQLLGVKIMPDTLHAVARKNIRNGSVLVFGFIEVV
jgi:hypothetical protein